MTLRSHIGYTTDPTEAAIDGWRVKLFCKAIGETDPVYTDLAAAQEAGHRACPVPPTYLKAVEGEHRSTADLLKHLKVAIKNVLHAEQSFTHHTPVYVGDTVEVWRQIMDIYDKKEGALTFIVIDSFYRVAGATAASSRQVVLVRNTLGA